MKKTNDLIAHYRKTINPPYSRQDFPIIGVTLVFFFLVAALVFLLPNSYKSHQTVQIRASDSTIARLDFNPSGFATKPTTKQVNLSVLAYDSSNNPIYSGVTYEWGISSVGGVGSIVGQGSIASFYPLALGSGDIFVTARTSSQNFTSSIPVFVTLTGIAPTPTPTSTPAPTPTPTLTPTPTSTPTPTPIPVDRTSPTVTIVFPVVGVAVTPKSTVNIAATATDNVGVTKVEFYINNILTCADPSSPYSCAWKVPNPKNKTYVISAKAYDAAGNSSQSSISVIAK